MKSKKQMRNIFIKRIDDILIRYYKEMDFDLLSAQEIPEKMLSEDEGMHRRAAMELIELMRELELISATEFGLLTDVYQEYFSLYKG